LELFVVPRHMFFFTNPFCGLVGWKIFQCGFCPKTFINLRRQVMHSRMLQMHGMNDDQALSPPPAQPLKRVCKVCDARFAHKSELRAHRKAEHSEIVMDDMLPDALGNTPTKAMPVAPNPEPELPSVSSPLTACHCTYYGGIAAVSGC